ncbi:hypothetical protein GY31_04740 [Lysinibacillus sphaericus]|uniref:hypothetical protein n=1 Tax=Lysinibacillus TaxID=400634 RepID=UPI00084B015B|nr:hypothetical protein [Lysinibacillus sphaericus]OEC03019.1 hypothetical protein GY31_04740 [Lysinibacillus sphaericus]
MKKIIFSAALVLSLGLAGCGETKKENVSGTAESASAQNDTDTDNSQVENEKDDTGVEEIKINQVVVDNESYKATLVEIVKKTDDIWGNSIDVIYEIENKLDYTIGVQARSVSADGYMVDEAILNMSQEVGAGKKAKAILTISDFDGHDFPELKSDLEMQLYVFNYDTFIEIAEHEVKVSF